MFNKIKIFVSVMFVAGVIGSLSVSDTFAHTAAISTDRSITFDVAAAGNNANSGADNLSIVSTCPLGYTLTIKGPSNSNLYPNGDSTSSSYIAASSGTRTNPTSITGNNLGTWGYTTMSGAEFNSNYFIGLTGTETQLLTKASASSSYGDNYSVLYAASVTPTIAPGAYTLAESSQGANDDAIVYYLTPNANCASYTIRYNDNGANSSTTMGITHNVVEDDEVTLAASNYQRSGYGFAGWSTVQLNPDSATFQTDLATAVADGNVFGPNETITADANLLAQATVQNNTQYITMYAIWVKPATNTTYLQNWRGCDDLSTGNVIALIDQRDNQAYAVSKLADGECWMIENLRLEAANSSDATKAQGYGGVFAGLATAETANFSNSTTANSKYYSGTQSGTATINIGTTDNPGYRFPRYNNSNTNSTVSNMTAANANVYSYGNYYNWAAAKANTSKLDNENNSNNANTSLCPAGWKLPTGKGDGDYGKLSNSLGGYKNAYNVAQPMSSSTTPTGAEMSNTFRSYPNNFVYAALIDIDTGNPEFERGAYGQYLTATARNSSDVYHFVINNTNTYPGTWNLGKKYDAGSVRCVASAGYTITFNANGGTGTMENQTLFANESAKLSANAFSAPAMGQSYQNANNTTISATAGEYWVFWGWNTNVSGTGDWYKDRESVSSLASEGNTITLYAQWKQATLADMATPTSGTKTITHTTMQDMSGGICWNSEKFTAIGTPYGQATLTDDRDGVTRSYSVAKLPDGYCWMTQNLNLGTSTAITLTSDDTDLKEGTTFTLPASSSSDFSASATTANYNKATVLNDMTIPDYTVNNTLYSGKTTAYYSYAAATADTSTYSKTYRSEVETSICPKNWDLPTSERYYNLKDKGEISYYNNTSSSYLGKNAGNEPYYFVYGGYRKAAGSTIDSTTFNNPTTYAYLWMANNSTNSNGIALSIYSSGFYTGSVGGVSGSSTRKYYGLAVRCVANMDDVDYRITFINTNTGETQTQIVGLVGENDTAAIELPARWVRSGYGLSGWDTNSSGTNIVYTNGQTITLTSDLTLYTVWKQTYTIGYNGNGADEGVMTNVKHTNTYENDVFDLFASNYSKAGYGFAGWSFDQNAQPGGSSRIYGPNEAITAPAGTPGETKTLYAVWVQSAGNLQGWQGCSSMSVGDVTALTDTRDNNVYTVGKLADENCWMMENLRLNHTYSSDSTKAQGFGGVFAGLADSETSFPNSATANSLYYSGTQDGTATIDIGTTNTPANRFPRYNANVSSRVSSPSVTDDRYSAFTAHKTSFSGQVYSYGNYYNWAAAKANTLAASSATLQSTSICPAGWKLPYGNSSTTSTGNTSGGFYYLGVALGATASNETSSRIWRSYPNNYVFSGYYYGSTLSNGGTGYYLSANSRGVDPYMLNFYYDSMSAGGVSSSASSGRSVRCVAETGLEVTLMLNDGTGRVGGRSYAAAGSSASLYTPTRDGYTFVGWNTVANGSGKTSYTGSYTFRSTATQGVTLYAIWNAV